VIVAAAVALAAPPVPAGADEGGVSFWTPGQYASLAAVPPSPGWSLPTQLYWYTGVGDETEPFRRGTNVAVGLASRGPVLSVAPTWAPDLRLLGGQPSVALSWGYGRQRTSADVTSSATRFERNFSDAQWGGTDLYPLVNVAWSRGVHNWLVYGTGDVPVGAYDANRLSNLGIGHGAIDGGAAYTYLDQTSGWEGSATLGVTYNFENPVIDYQNGVDSHLDWAVSRFFGAFQVGIAGYVYYQLTDDSGIGATLGGFRSRVAAVGPEVAGTLPVLGRQWSVAARTYFEFWAANRTQGQAVFATLSIPLTP